MLNQLLFLGLGLTVLTIGADWLVRGASRLAAAIGVSQLAIGLTIVAYGTSAPELVVNINSALLEKFDIAIGNVVGSNIFNVLFILGLCALIAPLKVDQKLIKLDTPIMVTVSGLFYLAALDYKISRFEGVIFLLGVILYTWFCFWYSKREYQEIKNESERISLAGLSEKNKANHVLQDLLFIGAGLLLLIVGSKWLVNSSIGIARYFGVSELVIALTIVAAGTSLPEVATSVVATLKGERDIAIGNVVGSNIYNILAILGVTALIPRGGLQINPASMAVDIPFMVLIAVLCYPVFRTKYSISRWEGMMFFSMYLGYTIYLIRHNQ
ncbi:MAG: calcium/sodium antiporter [Candidatus Omnitrophota bacterium]